MFLNISKLSIASLALISVSTFASVTTASFSSVVDAGSNFNEFSVSAGGVDITVSGWSDTDDMGNGNPLSGDDKITKAVDLDIYKGGWSMENLDEINKSNCGYHHSADNFGTDCGYQDYDMFLIEFSEAVNLSAASYGWIADSVSNTQVTVAALSDNTLVDKDWKQVNDNQTIASGYSQMQSSSGYFTNFTSSTSNVDGVFSNYWLIGALNTTFGGDQSLEGDDGLKLAGVSFTKQGTPPPSVSVPEPSSIMMFGLALFGFAATRRKIK